MLKGRISQTDGNTAKETKESIPQTNMWQEILREAMTKKDLEDSHIFIFGDKYVGKRSLIKVLNKDLVMKTDYEEQKKLLSIDELSSKFGVWDYTFLNVKKLNEQDSDYIGKMNVWISNDLLEKELFESAIKPDYLSRCMCLIVVDLSRPWEIIDSLKRWINYVYDAFSELLLKFPYEKQNELRNQIMNYIKLFEEPQFDEEGNLKREVLNEETIELKLQLELKEGLLATNIGIPIVFVVNKSDVVMQTGEKKKYEEDSEFIVKHIRRLALGFGASTIYVSGKQSTNLNVLYDYILHRLYKFELRHKPNVIDKDSYFIPVGYDSLTTLKNTDTQGHLDMLFEDRVPHITRKYTTKEEEVICEDTNQFLGRIKGFSVKKTDSEAKKTSSIKQPIEEAPVNAGNSGEIDGSPNKFDKFKYGSTNKVSFSVDTGRSPKEKEKLTAGVKPVENLKKVQDATPTSTSVEKKDKDDPKEKEKDKSAPNAPTKESNDKTKELMKKKLEALKGSKGHEKK